MTLSLDDLAARSGVPLAQLHDWQERGFLRTAATFGPTDLTRVRLLQYLQRHGVGPDALRDGMRASGPDVETYIAMMHPSGDEASSLAEVAGRVGLPSIDAARRLVDALGLRGDDDLLSPEDVVMLEAWATALAVGMSEEAIHQLIRVYRDALGRVGEAEIRLFHFYVHEPLRTLGLDEETLMLETHTRAAHLLPIIAPTLSYFHRRGMAAAAREDLLLHIGAVPIEPTASVTPAQLVAGIVFTDLSSFTPMTEVMGDAHATTVVARFGEIVYDLAGRFAGRVVKQIGDACMLVFFEPGAAVSCALEIVSAVAAEPSFPAARSGVHWGRVLYREGDYLGAGVNLAARLVAVAERHQVLVSAAVRERIADLAGVELAARGSRVLKGIAEPQELYEARWPTTTRIAKQRDLVCGMELAPSEIAARLTLAGAERVFCSEGCLRRFVAAPQQYLV
jgi:class 3 adenylate cyclase